MAAADTSTSTTTSTTTAVSTRVTHTPSPRPPYKPPSSLQPPPRSQNAGNSDSDRDREREREKRIQALLHRKRREIDTAIEQFQRAKANEYQAFERELRSREETDTVRMSRSGPAAGDEGGGDGGSGGGGGEGGERTGGLAGARAPGEQRPLDLGGSLLDEQVRRSLGAGSTEDGGSAPASTAAAGASEPTPPAYDDGDGHHHHERELQVAGLFTPSYLPLLDHHRARSDLNDSETSAGIAMSTSAPSADGGGGNGGAGHVSAPPLASSLKSSSSGDSMGRKLKSPKRVTFAFEDENSVPSRSSPPPTKVTWTIGDGDDEDGFESVDDDDDDLAGMEFVGEEYVEDPEEEDDSDEDGTGSVQQVEDVAMPPPPPVIKPGSWRDELVVPTTLTAQNGGNSVEDQARGYHGLNGTADGSDSDEDDPVEDDDDDADGGLFDLDEQIPDSPPRSPPRRDVSPLTTADSPSALGASMPLSPPLPASVTATNAASFTATNYRSQLSPALPARTPFAATGGIAGSLPSWATATGGFTLGSPKDAGRFRRRSVTKYIPSPPSEEESSASSTGVAITGGRAGGDAPVDATTAGDGGVLAFGSSLPISISAARPAAPAVSTPPMMPELPTATTPFTANNTTTTTTTAPSPVTTMTAAATTTAATATVAFASAPKAAESDAVLRSLSARPSSSPPPAYTARPASPPREPTPASAPASAAMRMGMGMGTFRRPAALMPYRTRYAQELAEAVEREGGPGVESVVGGIDGGTGLDPGIGSWEASARKEVPMSMSMRLAMEEGAFGGRGR